MKAGLNFYFSRSMNAHRSLGSLKNLNGALKKAFLIVFTLLFSATASAAQQDALTQLSQRLAAFDTYQAKFSQKTTDDHEHVLQKSTGLVMIKRPGKFRWVILQPSKQTLVTNGQWFWFYDVDLAQATRQKLSDKTAIDPARILSGSAKELASNFNVRGLFVGKDSTSFLLTPKKADYGFKKLILTFQDKSLIGLIVENTLSQLTVFKFSDIILNKPLSDALFNFQPPADVDVVTQ